MAATTTSSVEIWKDIPGFEKRYQASTLGRIRSVDRIITVCGKAGLFARRVPGRILKPGPSATGHLTVCLKRYQSSSVHALVLLTFLGPRPLNADIRHLDGNPQNNRLDNLCYGTRTENILDVYSIGKPWRKLTTEQVHEIRQKLKKGGVQRQIAKEYGVQEGCISAIKHGRIYGWLKEKD